MINSKNCLPVPGQFPFFVYSPLFFCPVDNFHYFFHKIFQKSLPKLAIPSVGLCHSFQDSCKCVAPFQSLDPKQNKKAEKPKSLKQVIYHMGFSWLLGNRNVGT